MLIAGVGAQLAVLVEVRVGRPGLQEQAELMSCLSALQPGVTRAGRPVDAMLMVVV